MEIQIFINPHTASKRTRRCLKAAGPSFELIKYGEPAGIRHESILVRSSTTGWFGWLPVYEIKVKSKGMATQSR